jgi:hypothetical protein
MSSRAGRDDQQFVKLFLSAYDQFSWRDADVEWLDQQGEGAVEARATRRSDGKTLAIEHTLIEPFSEDKSDLFLFKQHFLPIRDDESLRVEGRGIRVYVPVGTLKGLNKRAREVVAEAVHMWISKHRLNLRDGEHRYSCPVPGTGTVASEITLTVKSITFPTARPGSLLIGRQQVTSDLDKIIEKEITEIDGYESGQAHSLS